MAVREDRQMLVTFYDDDRFEEVFCVPVMANRPLQEYVNRAVAAWIRTLEDGGQITATSWPQAYGSDFI